MATAKDEMTLREPADFIGFSKEVLEQSRTEVSPNTTRLVGKTVLAFGKHLDAELPTYLQLTQTALWRNRCVVANSAAASRADFPLQVPFAKKPMVLCPVSLSLPSFVCREMKCLSSGFSRSPAFYGQWKESLLVKDQVKGNTKLSITEQENSLSSYSQLVQLELGLHRVIGNRTSVQIPDLGRDLARADCWGQHYCSAEARVHFPAVHQPRVLSQHHCPVTSGHPLLLVSLKVFTYKLGSICPVGLCNLGNFNRQLTG